VAYRVDQIKTVEPENVEDFRIDREKDYVTLVTCTPYGVNSHRLLVRGVRIPYEEPEQDIQTRESESKWMRQYLRGILTGLVVLAVVMASYKIWRSRRN
ncbi:MAG: sortase, partial [Anaerovoracaceae bacterium]